MPQNSPRPLTLADYQAIIRSAPDALVVANAKGEIVLANDGIKGLLGHEPEELLGEQIELLIPERMRSSHQAHRSEYNQHPRHRPMGIGIELIAVHKDGREIPVEVSLSPIRMGEEILVASNIRDITARKQSEKQLNTLIAELNHRVKNTLNLVLSIARRTVRQSESLDDFKSTFELRIGALTDLHRILSQNQFHKATIAELLHLALKPFLDLNGSTVTVDGSEISLNQSQAQSLCFILHELASNATKHGALSGTDGRIKVGWKLVSPSSGGKEVSFSWREFSEPPVSTEEIGGFGITLIEQIVNQELNGQCKNEFNGEGFSCQISFLLAD